jgi:hypothetical protein
MSKLNDNPKTYSFYTYGHSNILAEHVKTLEFTKDADITERGDCIVGVRSEFDSTRLKEFSKKIRVTCEAILPDGRVVSSEFKCKVNPNFNHDHELVLRKSGFSSDRTFGLGLNRGANWLNREIVSYLKTPGSKMKVTIKQGWQNQ